MESTAYFTCHGIRELRNCGMCQHSNYHHTSRFLSTPSLGKHGGSSHRDKHLSGAPFSAVLSLVCPRTIYKGLLWPLTWPDFNSMCISDQPIAMTVRLLLWGSESVRNGGWIFRQTRTRRKTFAHGNSNTICDLWCLQLVEQMLMGVRQKVN